MTHHAHPEMLKSSPVIPNTVTDQIKLWEMERNRSFFSKIRISSCKGYLYQMFNRFQDYNDVLKYATDFGYVQWNSDEKMMLFVTTEGHQHVKEYIKQRSQG